MSCKGSTYSYYLSRTFHCSGHCKKSCKYSAAKCHTQCAVQSKYLYCRLYGQLNLSIYAHLGGPEQFDFIIIQHMHIKFVLKDMVHHQANTAPNFWTILIKKKRKNRQNSQLRLMKLPSILLVIMNKFSLM